MKRKNFLNLIFLLIFSLSAIVLLIPTNFSLAQSDPYGVNDMELHLDPDIEPRRAIVNIINIALSFLGLIAVIIIIYGGFVWMTSAGEAEKINQAKRILKHGLIGLVIILLAWGIATFIINQFAGGLTGEPGDGACNPGQSRQAYICLENNIPCYGTETCLSTGFWGSPVHTCNCDDAPNGGTGGAPCDSEPQMTGCFPDHNMCAVGYYCSSVDCTCQAEGSLGDSCNADYTDVCTNPDDDLCGPYLTCNEDECICEGPPVITSISPVGGFCENNINQACLSDNDCGQADVCNLTTPNGAVNNFITILGHNFGQYSENSKVIFKGPEAINVEGRAPTEVNSNCIDTWHDNQIIIAVPAGADLGSISVIANNGKTGSTNDGIGPDIADFLVNNINRPGLCSVSPDSGFLNDDISYQGINLFNVEAYFGNYEQNIKALNPDFDSASGLHGEAQTPNVNPGKMSTFAQGTVSGSSVLLYSNYLDFTKNSEPEPGPHINSFSPDSGAPGQYVTIDGSGFGNNRGNSQVYFGNNEANYSFPEVCLHSVWTNNKVIIKVPEGVDNGNYVINMDIAGETISTTHLNPNYFTINSNLLLKPSLCKISPIRGQADTEVSFWGEYFGSTGDSVSAVFNHEQVVEGELEKEGIADYFSAQVPDEAITGPVSARRIEGANVLTGNSLNFEIGPCQTDADCGDYICCPVNTYKANRCAPSLNDCAIDIPNSVFEWSFSTDFGEIDNPCALLNSLEECNTDDECCYNFKEDKCQLANSPEILEDGHCPFYDCQEEDKTVCDAQASKDGRYIDFETCQLQCASEPGGLGLSCFNRQSEEICDPYNICSLPFKCLKEDGEFGIDPKDDCGICCCLVGDEDSCNLPNTDNLVCQPNQSPCTGDDRGLCCGCSQDIDCGSPAELLGCGYDTCCRARPAVIRKEIVPSTGETNVCRNAIISIPFNQRMDINSLIHNTMLLEERDYDDVCPSGTMAVNDNFFNKKGFFDRLLASINYFFSRVFGGIKSDTVLALPSSEKLYCLIPGSTQVKQEAEHSVLLYHPYNLLRDDTTYYIVIKGDENLDSQTGVLSAWGVGMNGDGLNGIDGAGIEFNLVSYPNSFISTFKTMDDQQTNAGVCVIDYVRVSPSSYLFNTTENDLNEVDNNPNHPTFDTKRDRDKVFVATAYSYDNQAIAPTSGPGYRWDWQWNWNDIILEEILPLANERFGQIFLGVRPEITDASTILEATVDMSNYDNFDNYGDGISGQSNITVFVCRNPWPAIMPGDLNWQPWIDDDYNYQFYYCRDDGGSTFADDLPAIIHPAITSGPSEHLICSTTNQPCTEEETAIGRCGVDDQGFCVWSVLRESYFFRQARPSGGIINSIEDLTSGGEVLVDWTGKANFIYHSNQVLRGHYRLYYAQDDNNFSFIEVDLDDDSDDCSLSADGQEYNCSYIVSGLENNQLYVFRASAVSRTNIETFFGNEVKVIPTDQSRPLKSGDCKGDFITETILDEENEEIEIKVGVLFGCENLDDDVFRLRLYHGISANNYGQYFQGEIGQYDFEFDIDYFNPGVHHFAISAFNEAGNEGDKSDNFSLVVP